MSEQPVVPPLPVRRLALVIQAADGPRLAGEADGVDRTWRLPRGDVPGLPWSHWVTPPGRPERFATWIHVVDARPSPPDEREDRRWYRPSDVLTAFRAGELRLGPPTWWTLTELARHTSVDDVVDHVRSRGPQHFAGRLAIDDAGRTVTLYQGDAGWESGDPDVAGARHRLVWHDGDFSYLTTDTRTAH